ncbi:MAG: Dabb family protein [Candidatus Kapaibacterium sp.]
MVKHLVFFRFKEAAECKPKIVNIAKVKDALEELPGKINFIKDYEVGFNVNESERAWDMSLISSFDDTEQLREYSVHPEHVKVVNFIKQVVHESAVVDYEL